MGIIEVNHQTYQLNIISDIFLYGNAVDEFIRTNMEEEINSMWNEPRALVWYNKIPYLVNFFTEVFIKQVSPQEVNSNTNPRNNYFRIEEMIYGNISFVDGLGCNTGYFKVENLYKGSTTSAHEYGHTLGLPHPHDTDYRGKGMPGIMYPRGTLVDAEFQYDANAKAGEKGGTLYPIHRKVSQKDIDDLYLTNLLKVNRNVLGQFSSVYHKAHSSNQYNL